MSGSGATRAPQIEEDDGPGEHRAGPARPQARELLTYAGEVEGRQGRGRAGLPARGARVPQRPVGRAAKRGLRRDHRQAALLRRLPAPALCQAGHRGGHHAGRGRRQGREGDRLPHRSRRDLDPAAGGRHRRVAPADAGRRERGLAVHPRAVRTHPARAAESNWSAPVEPGALREPWLALVEPVLAEATLRRPQDGWAPTGGRRGIHTEHLSLLLAEMQSVHRTHTGASW